MGLIGLFTDIGINKSREAQSNTGFKIFPESFSVSNVASPSLDPAITTPNAGVFFTGSISSYVPISDNTVQVNCVIPPSQTATIETIREIYVNAKDISNNDFLLAIGQPEVTSTVIYDPTGETTLRLQFTLVGADLTSLFEFAFTQATEISQHNLDVNAHPVIQDAIKKAGIFPQPIQHRYIGQHFDQFAEFAAGVLDNDLVYKDTDGFYKKALYAEGSITSHPVGFADVTNGCVYVEGLVDVAHAYPAGTVLYLSQTTAGLLTDVPTGTPLGHAVDDEVIALRIAEKNTVDSIFDAIVSDEVGYKHYPTYEEAIAAAPNGGWIRVDKTQLLRGSTPLSLGGKRLNIVHTGTDTGLEVFGGINEIQRISFSQIPDSGKYVLVHDGNKTADIAFNADAATLEAALEALPSINDVSVTGSHTTEFNIEFVGVDGLQPITAISAGIDIGVDEIQRINFSSNDFNGGSFELEFNGSQTNAIPFNAITAANIQAELNALASVNEVSVALEPSPPAGQVEFVVTFLNLDGKQNQNSITAPAPDNSLVDSGSSPISIAISTDVEGVLPDITLESSSNPVTVIPSTLVEGELAGSLTALEIDVAGTQLIGLGRIKNFNLGIDLNNQIETRIEMLFDNVAQPLEATGLVKNIDYNTDGSIGLSEFEIDDATLFRELVRVDPNPAPDAAVNISAAEVVTGDGSKWGFTVDQFVSTYSGGSVDFSTGAVLGGGDNFTPYTPTSASRYFKYGIALTVNSEIIVLPPLNDGATPAAALEPIFENVVARAIVTVQDNGSAGSGTILPVGPSSLKRFFTNTATVKTIKSEEFITAAPNEDEFTVSTFEWFDDDSVLDIEVYLNGDKQFQSRTGTADKDFYKVDKNTIKFAYPIPYAEARVEIVYVGNSTGSGTSGFGLVKKYKEIADGVKDTFSPTDPLFTWTASNSVHDIEVLVNGNVQDMGAGNDYQKISTNQIQFSYVPHQNAKIIILSKTSGGGVGGSGAFVTQDEGGTVDTNTQKYNFIGPAVTASQTSLGEVDIAITGEANTGSNEGTGVGEILMGKVGENLQFRNITGGLGLQVTLDANNNIVIGLAPSTFFISHNRNYAGLVINPPNIYDPATNKLSLYRNGLRMHLSATIGIAAQRYLESSPSSITLFDSAEIDDVFSYVNVEVPPSSFQVLDNQTGTNISINTYTLGTNRLRVWKNGILMNTAGLGPVSYRYSELDANTITLDLAAVTTDVFVIEHMAVAPLFVENRTGIAGTSVSLLSNTFNVGNNRQLIYRNGVLAYNSTDTNLGPVAQRYQIDSTTSILLEGSGSQTTDTWTILELA